MIRIEEEFEKASHTCLNPKISLFYCMDARIDLAERKLALISEISMLEDSKLIDQLMQLVSKGRKTATDEISPADWAAIQRGIEARDAGQVISLEEVRKQLANM